MIREDVQIINRLGLHARAATRLVNCASRFSSNIVLSRDGKSVNGKSIMGVLTLAAAQGSTLQIEVEGKDQEQALEALTNLIADRFGEED
jgi:phosphocarrier protein